MGTNLEELVLKKFCFYSEKQVFVSQIEPVTQEVSSIKNRKLHVDVKGTSVTVLSVDTSDYISLTDVARFKDPDRTDYIIQN